MKTYPGKVVCFMRIGNSWIKGTNDKSKTSPAWYKFWEDKNSTLYTRHAEQHALQLLSRQLKTVTLHKHGWRIKEILVLRWTKNGELAMAKPCKHCQVNLKFAGINPRNIWYSTSDGQLENLREYTTNEN